jgi:hypothetical protein
MLGKFVSFLASCIAEVESVEAEGVIRLTGGRPPLTTADGLTVNGTGLLGRQP